MKLRFWKKEIVAVNPEFNFETVQPASAMELITAEQISPAKECSKCAHLRLDGYYVRANQPIEALRFAKCGVSKGYADIERRYPLGFATSILCGTEGILFERSVNSEKDFVTNPPEMYQWA